MVSKPQTYLVASGGRAGADATGRLLVPLLVRESLAGVLELVPGVPRSFSAHDIGLAESVGSAVSGLGAAGSTTS